MNMIECPYCNTKKKLFVDCPKCGKLSMGEGINGLALELGHNPTLLEIREHIFKRERLKYLESMK